MKERKILNSWKAIAAYLKRCVRICVRWEEEMGLPVRRLDGSPKARVFAYADELDRWMAEKLAEREEDLKKTARERARKMIIFAADAAVLVIAAALIIWNPFSVKSSAAKPAPAILP